MKKQLLILAALLISVNITHAQTSARDWTKNDCNDNSHHLFDELDNGKIVIMVFVMPCPSCITATRQLEKIYNDYAASHPGKVVLYGIDDDNGSTCGDLNDWRDNNFFSLPMMTDGAADMSHYAVAGGMPSIVIVAGKDHKTYRAQKNFKLSDTTAIRQAINDGIAATSGVGEPTNEFSSALYVYPSPANAMTMISYVVTGETLVKVDVFNTAGEKVKTLVEEKQEEGKYSVPFDTRALTNGLYTVRLAKGSERLSEKFIVMH